MRKQTKVVAVASAAALLAIGGAMTSFAAQGWVEEDGTWYFYDKDGNRVEDQWKKSGDNWFWLDGEDGGAMATDKLIDDDGDTYYVDGNGVMVTNTWVKVVNEDQDDDDDPAEYHYYYMQKSGKAYKASDNSTSTKFRTIDGKKYAFDADGKMLYGWVTEDGELATGDDGWKDAKYYCGSWEDGSMKTGWQKVTVYDDEDGKDDDYDYWFNFKSNGEKRGWKDSAGKENWKSNGKYYSFDGRGVMIYEWALASGSTNASSVSNWRYYNSPEDGARQTKGWFKVVAASSDNDNTFDEDQTTSFAQTHANDESEKWYYAGDKGVLYEGIIKNIKGKYYAFWPDDDGAGKGGAMLTGLCVLQMENGSSDQIVKVIDDDIDSDALDDILDRTYKGQDAWDENVRLYYFGNNEDSDGAMKTGNVNINLDGSSYTFQFQKTGNAKSGRGMGVTGIDDNKYIYSYGCRIKADSDDKYQLVSVTNDEGTSLNINAAGVKVEKLDPKDLDKQYTNKDDEVVNYTVLSDDSLRLVNVSGNIQKSKTGAKDGNDCYYYVNKKYVPQLYTDNKTLKSGKNSEKEVSDWTDLLK